MPPAPPPPSELAALDAALAARPAGRAGRVDLLACDHHGRPAHVQRVHAALSTAAEPAAAEPAALAAAAEPPPPSRRLRRRRARRRRALRRRCRVSLHAASTRTRARSRAARSSAPSAPSSIRTLTSRVVLRKAERTARGLSPALIDPAQIVPLCEKRCLYAFAEAMTVSQKPVGTCECWANCTEAEQVERAQSTRRRTSAALARPSRRGAAQPARGAAAAPTSPPFAAWTLRQPPTTPSARTAAGSEPPRTPAPIAPTAAIGSSRRQACRRAAPAHPLFRRRRIRHRAAAVAPAAQPAAAQPQPARGAAVAVVPTVVATAAAQPAALAAATVATAAKPTAAQSAALRGDSRRASRTRLRPAARRRRTLAARGSPAPPTASTLARTCWPTRSASTPTSRPTRAGGLNNGQPPGCHIACGVVGFEYDCAIVGHTFGFRTVERLGGHRPAPGPVPRDLHRARAAARGSVAERAAAARLAPCDATYCEEPDAGTDGVRNAYRRGGRRRVRRQRQRGRDHKQLCVRRLWQRRAAAADERVLDRRRRALPELHARQARRLPRAAGGAAPTDCTDAGPGNRYAFASATDATGACANCRAVCTVPFGSPSAPARRRRGQRRVRRGG